jgi:predicted choloylglycine hydrolase
MDFEHKYYKYKAKYSKLRMLGSHKGGKPKETLTDFTKSKLNTKLYDNFNQVGINALTIVEGKTHYEVGKQLGKSQSKRSVPKFGKIKKELYDKQYAIYEKYYPEYLDTIKGMADKLKIDVDKFTYSLISYEEPVNGCSILSYNNLIGRNYDWMCDSIRTVELIRADIKGFNKFVTIREGGFPDDKNGMYSKNYIHPISFCVDFINDKFLYCGMLWMNFSGKVESGISVFDYMRKMIETCDDVDDVIKFAKITPCGTPKFIYVADAKGNNIVIEHYSGLNYFIRKPSHGLLAQTNHIINKPFIEYDNEKRRPESKGRLEIIENKCTKFKPENLFDIKTILDSINVFAIQKNKASTTYQLLMDLPNKKIYFFTKYKLYQLHELL